FLQIVLAACPELAERVLRPRKQVRRASHSRAERTEWNEIACTQCSLKGVRGIARQTACEMQPEGARRKARAKFTKAPAWKASSSAHGGGHARKGSSIVRPRAARARSVDGAAL